MACQVKVTPPIPRVTARFLRRRNRHVGADRLVPGDKIYPALGIVQDEVIDHGLNLRLDRGAPPVVLGVDIFFGYVEIIEYCVGGGVAEKIIKIHYDIFCAQKNILVWRSPRSLVEDHQIIIDIATIKKIPGRIIGGGIPDKGIVDQVQHGLG